MKKAKIVKNELIRIIMALCTHCGSKKNLFCKPGDTTRYEDCGGCGKTFRVSI